MFSLFLLLLVYAYSVFVLTKKQEQPPSIYGGFGYLPHGAAISNRKFLTLSILLFFIAVFFLLVISRLISPFYYDGAIAAIVVLVFTSLIASIKIASDDNQSFKNENEEDPMEAETADFFLIVCKTKDYIEISSESRFQGMVEKTPFENILVASSDALIEIMEKYSQVHAFPWSNEMHEKVTQKYAEIDELCKEKIQTTLKLETEVEVKNKEIETLTKDCNELKRANTISNAALHEARSKSSVGGISPERMTKMQAEEELKKTKERLRMLEKRLENS